MEDAIVRLLQGRASAMEELRLRQWLSESEANEREYRELAEVWRGLVEREIRTLPPPVEEVVERARRREVRPFPAVRARPGRHLRRWAPLAAAALVVMVLGAAELVRRQLGSERVLAGMTLTTEAGQTTMAELGDGTIVHLAPGSRLEVVPEAGRRVVWLEGRAFFGVARHAGWPFVVRSRLGEAQVLGTRFEFSTDTDDVRVVVVDGRVAFSSSGARVEVGAGQMSVAAADAAPVVAPTGDVEALLAWMGQSLVFHDTPLRQAAGEIQARYGRPVEVRGAELGRRTVSGGFEHQSFEQVVSAICRVVAAQCTITPGNAVIESRI